MKWRVPNVPKGVTKKALRLVRKFDQAARDLTWIGSGDPDEDDKLLPAYKTAKTNLLKFIGELERKIGVSHGRKEGTPGLGQGDCRHQ